MKKAISFAAVLLMLISCLVGCTDSNAKRIVGTWEYRSDSQFSPLYQKYVFEKGGTGNYQKTGMIAPREYNYTIDEDGKLSITRNDGFTEEGSYIFNEDYTVLTITFNSKTYDYRRAK